MAQTSLGKASGRLSEDLRSMIVSGAVPSGEFLPSVRELCRRRELSIDTVVRAMRRLESDGLISAEPRRGYRVLERPEDEDRGRPIAYLLSAESRNTGWAGLYQMLFTGLQRAAGARGWSLLGIGTADLGVEAAIEQCRASNAWGLIADVHSPEVVRLAQGAGLSVVMVDVWQPGLSADAVVQDNFGGGFLAGQFLAEAGHKDIVWLGPVNESIHSMARFAGASAALRSTGIGLPEEKVLEVGQDESRDAARELLSSSKRPAAILAMWRKTCLGVATAARELGLELGRDLQLVGWCAEEQYADGFAAHFPGGPVPAVVSWSIAEMAEMAVGRLVERRSRPELPPARINVKASLKTAHAD
jgi:DNA-binding LacI/PurR family transcriptional regulator